MKNLKFLFTLLVIIAYINSIKSQEKLIVNSDTSEECLQNLSIFAESAKVKNYNEAFEPWSKVRNECPSLNVAIYSYGERILKDKIKNGTDDEIDISKKDLILLYDQWLEYFPKKRGKKVSGDILSNKAQSMLDYNIGDKNEIYKVFDQAFKSDLKSFTNPKRLYNYFKIFYDMYKDGLNNYTAEMLFEKYEEVYEKFEYEALELSKKLDLLINKEESGTPLTTRDLKRKRIYDVNSNAIGIFLSNLNAIISKESSCENLISLYERNFEENKNNSIWLNRAASRMDEKNCSDDPLFVTLVERLHTLEPSAASAYYLGFLNDKRGKSSEALKYYEESIELETDKYKKAKILYKIALKFKNKGRKSTARKYALKALSFQPSLGKAYLTIANLYASSANDCGESQFQKRAVYWLAAQTARKAAKVDASVKKIALKTAESYYNRAPSKTDIFTEGNSGQTIQFSCWFSANVKVPSL